MQVTDPVCGNKIDVDQAHAREFREGWVHFFCSPDCHQAFLESPARYHHPPPSRTSGDGHG
jgi:YHS domain-containing protein